MRAFTIVKDLELRRVAAIKDVITAFAEAYKCAPQSHFRLHEILTSGPLHIGMCTGCTFFWLQVNLLCPEHRQGETKHAETELSLLWGSMTGS